MDEAICCRPNDRRGFIHRKILGLGQKALGIGSSLLPGPLGAVSRFVGGQLGGGGGGRVSSRAFGRSRPRGVNLPFSGAPGAGFNLFGSSRLPRVSIGERGGRSLPESDPMRKNRLVGITPQDTIGSAMARGSNGCPPEGVVCAPRGFHLNKSSYFLRDGSFIERGTKFVRNRRLNNANGRAQDKAIVRLEKGADNAKRLLKATGYRTLSKQSSRELRMRRRGHR